MLHRLEIENFYSIRERQVIDLRAAANAPEDNDRLAPLWKGSTERAPKVVALFGANASGKSNVLRALMFLATFVKNSFYDGPDAKYPYQRFAEITAQNTPTRIAIEFSAISNPKYEGDSEPPECRYAYEVTIGGRKNEPEHILYEALYYWPDAGSRRNTLFERETENKLKIGKAFNISGFHLIKILRPNASVLSTLAYVNHNFSKLIWRKLINISGNILIEKINEKDDEIIYSYDEDLINKFNKDIFRVDLGILKMNLKKGKTGNSVEFTHIGLDFPISFNNESHGTQQFWRIYPRLIKPLSWGGVVVIDEIDAAIHPLLLPEIVRWFHDPERNPHNAQLWITCHNASLLETLSKEEVFFCDKNTYGQTEVYGLKDITAVRREDNYYKKYLGGVYGAVPHIG